MLLRSRCSSGDRLGSLINAMSEYRHADMRFSTAGGTRASKNSRRETGWFVLIRWGTHTTVAPKSASSQAL